jgi:hypothetical protein
MVAIQSAESNRASIRILKEAVWGTTPGSGTSDELRFTGSSLVAEKQTQISDEIRADRMVPSVIEVGASSSGGISQEFSAGSSDPFFEAFLLGAWTQAMTFFQLKGTQVDITSTSVVTLGGGDYRHSVIVGRYFKLEGFQNAANNGYFAVSSVAFTGGNTEVTVSGTPFTVEAGNARSKFLDANDVILKSTATAFTSGNTINGGGSNSFAGKSLFVGQKIWVEGLGKETGTLEFLTTNPTAGDTVTISDGVTSVVFEIHTDAALIDENSVYVALSNTEATQAENLRAAIMTEFNKGTFDCSATIATATVTVTNHKRTGGSLAASGDAVSVTVTAFSGGSATKGGLYTIASLPNDDTIVVEETLSTDANAGTLPVVVKGSHLRNPGVLNQITKQSFTIETGFTDIAKYFVRNGMRVGSFEMNVSAGEIVTVDFEFMGRETLTRSSTLIGTSPYTVRPTTATDVMNATANVGAPKKNGVALDAAIMSIELSGEASLREQPAVGSRFPAGIGYGRFQLTGTLTAYFETLDFYNHFLNHDTISVSYDFTDADKNFYVFSIPALKITSDPISPEGIDQDVMEEMEFVALRDATLNTQFMIDRFSSIRPFVA